MFLTEIVHKALKCKSSNDDFESTNFAIFEEVVHNFGRSDDDMIKYDKKVNKKMFGSD